MLVGLGEIFQREVENQIAGDIVETGSAHHREDAPVAHSIVEAFQDMFQRQCAVSEEFFQIIVTPFGQHFNQRFMSGFGFFGHVGGDGDFTPLSVAVRRVGVRFHPHQVDDAAKFLFGADGKVNRDTGAAQDGLHTFQSPMKTRPLAVEPVNDDGPRH